MFLFVLILAAKKVDLWRSILCARRSHRRPRSCDSNVFWRRTCVEIVSLSNLFPALLVMNVMPHDVWISSVQLADKREIINKLGVTLSSSIWRRMKRWNFYLFFFKDKEFVFRALDAEQVKINGKMNVTPFWTGLFSLWFFYFTVLLNIIAHGFKVWVSIQYFWHQIKTIKILTRNAKLYTRLVCVKTLQIMIL